MAKEDFRYIPSVDQVKKAPELSPLLADHPDELVTQAVREVIEQLRDELSGRPIDEYPVRDGKIESAFLARKTADRVEQILAPHLVPVINATGVIIHTNLGRAPLGAQVWKSMEATATGYSNLEYDLNKGSRGSRFDHLRHGLCRITGAQDVLVVNNNAAAVLLVLTALARGREVVVSRGELVEIGGSFRLPEVMAQGGAILREVGATNKVRLSDFQQAICSQTGMILKAHQSNFSIQGFFSEVKREELVQLCADKSIPFFEDLGSGLLLDLDVPGVGQEDSVVSVVRAGVDLVSFSGDKMLGGPQAGIIVGRSGYIEQLRSHPLTRALRPDKLTLAGLEAAVHHYLDGKAHQEIPVLSMICEPESVTSERARQLAAMLLTIPGVSTEQIECFSTIGGGSQPDSRLPSAGVTLACQGISTTALESGLRSAAPAVIGRIENDRVVLDVKTVSDSQLALLVGAVDHAIQSTQKEEQ